MSLRTTVEQEMTRQRGFEIGQQAANFYDVNIENPEQIAAQWAIEEDRLEGNYPPVDSLLDDPAFHSGVREGLHYSLYTAARRRSL